MQNYSYKARDNYGKAVRGTMSADNEMDLANKLSSLGYFLVGQETISEERLRANQ